MVDFRHINFEQLTEDHYTLNDFRIMEVPDYQLQIVETNNERKNVIQISFS